MNDKAFNGDYLLGEEFKKLVKKFKIKNIVETGTYKADSTKEFSKMVENVYTIEGDKDFYSGCKKALKGFDNVKLIFGNSPDVLKKLLPSIKGNTLFFLDAHWERYWPIIDELNEISKISGLSKSVIAIHDFYVPGKEDELGYDSYYHSNSKIELWVKRVIGFVFSKLGMQIIEKQKLDHPFIKKSLDKINPNYHYYYNSKAVGSKRGVIFIHP